MRTRLSNKYIKGHGLEIGGLHCPLPVLSGVVVDYVDLAPYDELIKGFKDVAPVKNNIIVDDAETLRLFQSSSEDFVIANHVLEHCHNPIGTLMRWLDVCRPGGIVYAAIPEKTQTFDAPRKITPIDHLMKDFEENGYYEQGDREHYRDWLTTIDKLSGQVLEDRIDQLQKARFNIHFHVWDFNAIKELMQHPYVQKTGEVLEYGLNGAEVICVLRRRK